MKDFNKIAIAVLCAVAFFIAWCAWSQRHLQKEMFRQQHIQMLREEERHRANQTPEQKRRELDNWLNRDHQWNPDLKIWE